MKKTFVMLTLAAMLACPFAAGAAEVHPFLKFGIDLNGETYSDLDLGVSNRFNYGGGVDFRIHNMILVGGEFKFHHMKYEEVYEGVTGKVTENDYLMLGNVTFAPKMDSFVAPYGFFGMGVAYMTISGEIDYLEYPLWEESDHATKFAVHGGGGVKFGKIVFAEFEVQHIQDYGETDALFNVGVRF